MPCRYRYLKESPMGFVTNTPAGNFRANWRDPAGKQKAKTFRTKKEARAFLNEVEGAAHKGSYVDPHSGRLKFGEFAERWLASRSVEATTAAAWSSRMRARLAPRWGTWPLGKIGHLAVQEWVTALGRDLAPATVASCFGLFSSIMDAAVRARLIAVNPCEGVRLPAQRKKADNPTIDRADLVDRLLPAVPEWHRPLVAAGAGAGLRWGECLGLRWGSIDLEKGTLFINRVVVEVNGHVADKPYPKTAHSRRTVPFAPFLEAQLRTHRDRVPSGPEDRVFTNRAGEPMLRSNFRRQVWRPALVRAGLLGEVVELGEYKYRAVWPDRAGTEWSAEFTTERDAVACVAAKAAGGLRFHDLRHCFATWLVSAGLPVNVVQAVMGHELAITTLDLYTHLPQHYFGDVRAALSDAADSSLTPDDESQSTETGENQEDSP